MGTGKDRCKRGAAGRLAVVPDMNEGDVCDKRGGCKIAVLMQSFRN